MVILAAASILKISSKKELYTYLGIVLADAQKNHWPILSFLCTSP